MRPLQYIYADLNLQRHLNYMSQAFVKEDDYQWLHEIPGTMNALINYLTRENNGIRVYEKRKYMKDGVEVYEMSNGLSYSKNPDVKWEINW